MKGHLCSKDFPPVAELWWVQWDRSSVLTQCCGDAEVFKGYYISGTLEHNRAIANFNSNICAFPDSNKSGDGEVSSQPTTVPFVTRYPFVIICKKAACYPLVWAG